MAYDYTGYKYGAQPQPGQATQDDSKNPYALQNIPGITGGMNDMLRSALQGNPHFLSNMKNQVSPMMSALFTQPPATSSSTAVY